jgi:CheY-like chemotaxis protein
MSDSGACVLLVEDDDDIREVIQDALERRGYAIIAVEDGREALDRLEAVEVKPSLILLDMTMPTMSGWEFLQEQAKVPSIATIPVVVLSAVANLDKQAQAQQWAGILTKPVSLEKLLSTVARFCSTN